MEFVPMLALAALVVSAINFLKYVRTGDLNGVLTQLSVWVAGVIVVILVAATDWADGLIFGDLALSDMNTASLIFLGVSIGSVGSAGYDLLKSVDNSDSNGKPHLFN